MPELPEVETVARTLSPLVENKRITNYTLYTPSSFQGDYPLESTISASIGKAFRRGKLLLLPLTHTSYTRYLCFHLKMTGRLFVYPQNHNPNKHTRLIFSLDSGEQLFFDDIRKFGYIRLLCDKTLQYWPFWQSLGPEPFDIDGITFAQRCREKRTKIKALLLDQHIIAGCGNIYADESLFVAKIHPATPACNLTEEQLIILHHSLCSILSHAIQECGSSIKDYRTARGDVGSFQNYFRVYARAGKPCYTCSTPLQSMKVAGRTSVWCPKCQPILYPPYNKYL